MKPEPPKTAAAGEASLRSPSEPWPLAIFRRSVLKQAKYRALTRMLGEPAQKRCLDLGSDNGVISYLLRQRGGAWTSADLSERAVASIRSLVGTNVYRIEGTSMPFPDEAFDLIVVIDLLEHVHNDQACVRELDRILKPGGELVVNVPHAKRFALMRPIRNRLGLTDAWHGHVRPGYTLETLRNLLGDPFTITGAMTYSKLFSEALDVVLNYSYRRRKGDSARDSVKGVVVTGAEIQENPGDLKLLDRVYPLLRAFSSLDSLCVFSTGYYLVLKARKMAAGKH